MICSPGINLEILRKPLEMGATFSCVVVRCPSRNRTCTQ